MKQKSEQAEKELITKNIAAKLNKGLFEAFTEQGKRNAKLRGASQNLNKSKDSDGIITLRKFENFDQINKRI